MGVWLEDDVRTVVGEVPEFRIILPDGSIRWVDACSRGHFHDDGSFRSITSTWSDITERKRAEADLEHRASKDSLTGLLNRDAFTTALERAVAAAHEADDAPDESLTALLFVDLDGFKQVNDRRGHAAGDEVLEQVARRLVEAARRDDLVGRWGGDGFVLLCRDLAARSDAREIGERVIEAVQALGADQGVEGFGASVGVAFVADHPSGDRVPSSADRLVYQAKADGGGSVHVG
jgi:diguanylate cyclase (GGDEF)-like protein